MNTYENVHVINYVLLNITKWSFLDYWFKYVKDKWIQISGEEENDNMNCGISKHIALILAI